MDHKHNPYSSRILGKMYPGEQMALIHKVDQDHFRQIFQKVLDDYGLAATLEAAKAGGNKVYILEIGCSEGLFLHDVAEILETRGLLSAADLTGLDSNSTAIATAEEFCRVSVPPRPYLNFYAHPLNRPFEEAVELVTAGKLHFDFIYSLGILGYLRNARQHLERFYAALNPGGVAYFRDLETERGPEGIIDVHPVMQPISQFIIDFNRNLNKGVAVAHEIAAWLAEAGAEQIQAIPDIVPIGGQSERGKRALRSIIVAAQNIAPQLIQNGLMTQLQYDEMIETLYRELGPHLEGQSVSIDTLVRKPFTQS